MTEIFFPNKPRPLEDPYAAGLVQQNLEYVMTLFQKGIEDGDTLVWDKTLGRFLAKPGGGVESVTSLPLSDLFPGREILLSDSVSTPNFLWHLRYNPDSPSPYKWECMGGTPAFVTASAFLLTGVNTVYAPVVGGPTFALPPSVGGDFYITISGGIGINTPATSPLDVDHAFLSYSVGAVAASDNWATRVHAGGTTSLIEVCATGSMSFKHLNVAAGANIVTAARREGGNSWQLRGSRTLQVMPQRVG